MFMRGSIFSIQGDSMIGWMSEDRNSMLQLLILSTLADNLEKKYTLGEIIEILSEDFEDVWIPKRGSIYPAVNQLVNKKYLIKTDGRPMRVWLSSEGETRLPHLVSELLDNIKTFFEFVALFQENLEDNFPELRADFLLRLLEFFDQSKLVFEQVKKDTQSGNSGWKDVKIR